MNLHKLSEQTSVELDGGNVVIYDTRAYSPKRETTLTVDEMSELILLWTEGLCPCCLREIPMNDVICDECFECAKRART